MFIRETINKTLITRGEKARTHHRVRGGLLWCVVLLLITLSFATACSDNATYATFSRGVKQLDFTFEYPRDWWVSPVEQYSESVHSNIVGPDTSGRESPVTVFISVWLGLGPGAEEDAQRTVNEGVSTFKDERNFLLLRQDTINLDGANGYRAEYTFDILPIDLAPAARFNIPKRILDIAIPRNGMVYRIWISASQNEWNAREKDIQHILVTFRWK